MNVVPVRELLATKGVSLVRKLAREFAARSGVGLDESDFVSLGNSKLMEVGPAYDDARRDHPVKITTYLYPYVKGAMQDAVRQRKRELGVEGVIAQEITRESRRFRAVQSDEFDVAWDPAEVNRERFDATLSEGARRLAVRAAATAIRMKQRGTEEHLGELDEHRLVVEIVERTIAGLPPALQRLWQVHYVEDRTLAAYAAEQGISDATAERYHKRLREAVEQALFGKGIDGVPDVQ
jgi:RNA polymerase sigma factor (sigma-70 family)